MKKLFNTWLLTMFVGHAFSQGPLAHPRLQTCFQLLEFDGLNQNKNILRSSSYQFLYTANAAVNPDYWRIEVYDVNGLPMTTNYVDMGLDDGLFWPVINVPGIGKIVKAQRESNGEWITNNEVFHFDGDVEYVTITSIQYKEFPPNSGNWIYQEESNYLHLSMKEAGEVIDLRNNSGEGCYTFSNFNFALTISESLEGFCGSFGEVCLELTQYPLPVHSPYPYKRCAMLTENPNNLFAFDDFCMENCGDAIAPYYIQDPVPCGCMKFSLSAIIEPCIEAPEDCESAEILFDLNICCDCDVRIIPPAN